MKTTITEALAELKLIKKKVQQKQALLQGNILRAHHLKDPHESEGGTFERNKRELQSIMDLHKRYIAVKGSIFKANAETNLTIDDNTMSVNDWITWKREIANDEIKMFSTLHGALKRDLDNAAKSMQAYKDESGVAHLAQWIPNFDLGTLISEHEFRQTLLDKLDGKLSLINATVTIEV